MLNKAFTFAGVSNEDRLRNRQTLSKDYDTFGWLYEKYWSYDFSAKVMPLIMQHILSKELPDRKVLDLCCGTGTISIPISNLGYQVTGVDYSKAMLQTLKAKDKRITTIHSDIRTLKLNEKFSAILCTYDSLNYLTNEQEILFVFNKIYNLLQEGGIFFFDINMKAAYEAKLAAGAMFCIQEEDIVCAMKGYLFEELQSFKVLGSYFTKHELNWNRKDFVLAQRYFDPAFVLNSLNGLFSKVDCLIGADHVDVCTGKTFYICYK